MHVLNSYFGIRRDFYYRTFANLTFLSPPPRPTLGAQVLSPRGGKVMASVAGGDEKKVSGGGRHHGRRNRPQAGIAHRARRKARAAVGVVGGGRPPGPLA